MRMIWKLFASSITVVFLLNLLTVPTSAQNVDSANFTVQAIIPKNQVDKKQTYFDLMMKPGETQDLIVNLINTGKDEITIDVALRAASTNRNGIIEYQVVVTPDETLKIPFDTIAKTDPVVTLAAGETKKVKVQVTMPEEKFDGTILGGVVFTKREKGKAASGVAISNQFSYVVGVKLAETTKVIKPDFRLKSIEPTLINYRNAVVANIHNPVPLIIKDADVTARIYKKNQSKPLFSTNRNGVDMAPNSIFPLPIEWDGQTMEAGDYTLELSLVHNKKSYDWNQDFTIDAKKAQEINKNMLNKQVETETNWWDTYWWLPILIVVFLLLIWFAFILGKRRRKDEEDEKVE